MSVGDLFISVPLTSRPYGAIQIRLLLLLLLYSYYYYYYLLVGDSFQLKFRCAAPTECCNCTDNAVSHFNTILLEKQRRQGDFIV